VRITPNSFLDRHHSVERGLKLLVLIEAGRQSARW
jgi:hypothetical protein